MREQACGNRSRIIESRKLPLYPVVIIARETPRDVFHSNAHLAWGFPSHVSRNRCPIIAIDKTHTVHPRRFTLNALGRYMQLKFLWTPERILQGFFAGPPSSSFSRDIEMWKTPMFSLGERMKKWASIFQVWWFYLIISHRQLRTGMQGPQCHFWNCSLVTRKFYHATWCAFKTQIRYPKSPDMVILVLFFLL